MNKFLKWFLILWAIVDLITLTAHLFAKFAHLKNERGLKSEALFYYKIATALNPFYGESLKEISQLSEGRERESFLKRAVRFNGGDDDLHLDLARTYLAQNRIGEAIQEYEKAIEKNPKNVFYYSELAEVLLTQNQMGPARTLYQKAVQIEPLYSWAHYRLGQMLLAEGKKSAALSYFQNVLKIQRAHLTPVSDYSKRLIKFDFRLAEKEIVQLEKKEKK